MKMAYGGRAAAYEKKGELENALRDYTQVALLYGVELEVLGQVDGPDRDKVMLEAAEVYRNRARVLDALNRLDRAQADRQRADKMEAEAKKMASVATRLTDKSAESGQVQLTNAWTDTVEVIIEGSRYTLKAGEQKTISRNAGAFRYEVPAANYRGEGKVEAGKAFPIWIGPARANR